MQLFIVNATLLKKQLFLLMMFFHYFQPAQNQHKSQFLFQKQTLTARLIYKDFGCC